VLTRLVHSKLAAALLLLAGVAACSTTGGGKPAIDLELSDEPMVGKFVWHDLMTDDVEAARDFYGGLLGWTFEETVGPAGEDYTLVVSQGRYIGGMVHVADPGSDEYSRWLAYLSVADVDEAVETTVSSGGQAVVGPLDLGNIGRAAAISDPQGAVLGLLRSAHGDPLDPAALAAGDIVWNELLASDDKAAIKFYVSLAGFEAETEQRRGGEYTTLSAMGQRRAGIMPRPGAWRNGAVGAFAGSARRQIGGDHGSDRRTARTATVAGVRWME
jgi:predicted enzyme related to lactoylglutathione lyase